MKLGEQVISILKHLFLDSLKLNKVVVLLYHLRLDLLVLNLKLSALLSNCPILVLNQGELLFKGLLLLRHFLEFVLY